MPRGACKPSCGRAQGGVSRLVKQAEADTTLKNAIRDGTEWAWVPHGDTCPFCITLASNGWQRASKKALKGDHAQHIHAHCDCEYAIRFDSNTNVAGYDPDKYLKQYYASGGDINAMRRAQYARDKGKINAQKRAAYAARKLRENANSGIIDYSKAVFAGSRGIKWHLEKHRSEFPRWTEDQYLQRAREYYRPNWKAENWKKSAVPMAVFPVIASAQTSLWQLPAMEI